MIRNVKKKSEKFNSSAGLMSTRVSVGKGGVLGWLEAWEVMKGG